MKQDILTLVRELKIVRDENLKLQEELQMRRKFAKENKENISVLFQIMPVLDYLKKSRSEWVSNKANIFYDKINEIRVKYDRKPFALRIKKQIKTGSYETCAYCKKDVESACHNIDSAQICKNM